MQATACLLNWRRPFNLPLIVERLRREPEIVRILIWDNSGTLAPIDGAEIIHSERNICTLGRYKAIELAETDWIYTADDDVLVNNIPGILAIAEQMPNKIISALRDGHMRTEGNGRAPWTQLGWGATFKRDSIRVLDHWRERYGEDDLLERKADRIFTILHGEYDNVPANIIRLRDHDGGYSDESRDALYRMNDHYRLTREAARKALELRDAIRSAAAASAVC